jgi:serine/threonine-protein kinase
VPYVIMGYAGEDTLARRLREGELDRGTVLRIFVQVCRGVLALHDRRLVHFDLKPSNVFLKGDAARVGDYGLSRLMTEGRQTLSFGRGTPQYMAPEMLRGRADHRADVYSLGVILYECLTGRLPFETEVPGAVVLRETDEPPRFPEGFPPELRAVVVRCLRLSPEERYAGLAELLGELGQTARPGDSIRFEILEPGAPIPPAGERGPTPTSSAARSTAAELARGAVEVARGVWDGLRTATRSPRRPASGGVALETSSPAIPTPRSPPATPRPPPPAAPPSGAERATREPTPLAIHTLSSAAPARVEASPEAGPAGAATIPVPPDAGGGVLRTLVTSLALGLEVLVSLGRAGIRTLPRGLVRFGSGLVRGAGGLVSRVVRLALFVLVIALIGAALTTLVLWVLTGFEL